MKKAEDEARAQLEMLSELGVPVYYIPGNVTITQHDSARLFTHLHQDRVIDIPNVKLLTESPIQLSEGLQLIGLGGSPPSYIENTHKLWNGFPYDTREDCDKAVNTYLKPLIPEQGQVIIMTHFGPIRLSTSEYTMENGDIVEAGNMALRQLLIENVRSK